MTATLLQGKTVRELRDIAGHDARETLNVHWDCMIPVEPLDIARGLGITVYSTVFNDSRRSMTTWRPFGILIDVCKYSPPAEKRLLIARGIGYAVANAGEVGDGVAFSDFPTQVDPETVSQVYAGEFAAELLLPRRQFMRAVGRPRKDTTDIALAAEFDVPLQVVVDRRRALDI